MAKHRMDRINEEMKKELADIIRNEIKDPRISAMVSVTGVHVTSDLKYAKIYLSIFGKTKEEEKETLAALNRAKGFMRRQLSATMNLRNTPELTLIEDTSIDYGMHIDSILREVLPEKAAPAPAMAPMATDAADNEDFEADDEDLEEDNSAGADSDEDLDPEEEL